MSVFEPPTPREESSRTSGSRSKRLATGAAVLALAALGTAAGAGLYAWLGPSMTTTVSDVTTVDSSGQPVAASPAGVLQVGAIYRATYRGVVDIKLAISQASSGFGFFGNGGTQTEEAEGSGFVYNSKGDIVTNNHVISGATSMTVTLWNGQKFKGTVVGSDPSTDLAVIKIAAPSSLLHPLKLANSDKVQIGDGVVAIGSPFGLVGTVTSGIVSALHRNIDAPAPEDYTINNAIQTDAPINHGNSGGPLLNAGGEVIGINSQIQSDSGDNAGVGFAIPSNTVQSVISQLVAGHTVKHAYLGVSIESTETGNGIALAGVAPNGPAAKAGLRCGDAITALGGSPVTNEDALANVIDAKAPGAKLAVTYERGGAAHTVTVTLGTRPNAASIPASC